MTPKRIASPTHTMTWTAVGGFSLGAVTMVEMVDRARRKRPMAKATTKEARATKARMSSVNGQRTSRAAMLCAMKSTSVVRYATDEGPG